MSSSNCLSESSENLSLHTSIASTSLAVVPYDDGNVLPHERTSREFHLAGETFVIEQDWTNLGVAAVVWDSAVVLAEYLVRNSRLVKGKNVLELGAGTGLTGLVAAALGASVVTTERAEAVNHLKSTVEHNTRDKLWEIRAEVLDWTDKDQREKFGSPDIILGADIIYIEETFQHLLQTFLAVAKTEKTHILLSCKIRYDRDLQFLKFLKEHFTVEEELHDQERDIKVFSVRRTS